MTSIIPGYVYSLFASIIVGTLVIAMCGLSVAAVKHDAEEQQLSSIANYVAAKATELASQAPESTIVLSEFMELPSSVGNQRYWIRIQNDSSSAWAESGYGTIALSSEQIAFIPLEIAASGVYLSGSGVAKLEYSVDSSGARLLLSGGT
jgi:hypothetical protein